MNGNEKREGIMMGKVRKKLIKCFKKFDQALIKGTKPFKKLTLIQAQK